MTEKRTTDGDAAAIVALLGDVANRFVDALGLELVEVVVKGQPGRRIVRVVVDSNNEDGVDVDAIAALSRQVSEVLDEDEQRISGAWTLEVTSPGVDRPLSLPRHWVRNVGRYVHVVHRAEGQDEARETTGKLAEANDTEVVINVKGRMVTIVLDHVERAKVVLPW